MRLASTTSTRIPMLDQSAIITQDWFSYQGTR